MIEGPVRAGGGMVLQAVHSSLPGAVCGRQEEVRGREVAAVQLSATPPQHR
jgi:hypothetical protein